jgi:hypothetical protein
LDCQLPVESGSTGWSKRYLTSMFRTSLHQTLLLKEHIGLNLDPLHSKISQWLFYSDP